MRKSSLGRRSVLACSTIKSTPQYNDEMSGITSSAVRRNTFMPKSGDRTPRPYTMSTDSRRSSTSAKVKKDIRPLADKSWQQETSNRIFMYLNSSDCDVQAVLGNVRNLRNMSTDIFLNIFNFFMMKVDQNILEMNKANYITQIPVLMKKLEYPNKLDKSFLQTVNTQHNYGFVLGIFDYLLTLIEAKDIRKNQDWINLFAPFDGEEEDNCFDPQEMYTFARARFEEELEGKVVTDEDDCYKEMLASSGLSNDIFDEIIQRQEVLRTKKELLEQENATLQTLKHNQAELLENTVVKEKATAEAILQIDDFKQKIWQAERKHDEIVREIKSLENDLEQLTAVESQKKTVTDEIAEKKAEKENRSELNKAILEAEEHIGNLQDIIHSFDADIITMQDKLDKYISEYNQIALKVVAEVCNECQVPLNSYLLPNSSTGTEEQALNAFEAGRSVIPIVSQAVNECDESIIQFEVTDQELKTDLMNLMEEIQTKKTELEEKRMQEIANEESFKTICEHYETELNKKIEESKQVDISLQVLKKEHDDKVEAVKALNARVARFKEKFENYKKNNAIKLQKYKEIIQRDYAKLKERTKLENLLKRN